MFSNAYKIATGFTFPIVVMRRNVLGNVSTLMGAMFFVSEGWAVTASHIAKPVIDFDSQLPRAMEYTVKEAEAQSLPSKAKHKEMRRLDRDYKPESLLTNQAVMFGQPGVTIGNVTCIGPADLAIMEVTNFPETMVPSTGFPVMLSEKDGPEFGSSVMKYGYPFHNFTATFDDKSQIFQTAPDAFPILRFPLDGIIARGAEAQDYDGMPMRFLESTTPGLLGQSGGPWLDQKGRVLAVQSQTRSIQLGFSPEVDGKVEHQFLNVGVGTSNTTIKAVFDKYGVDATWT